MRKYKLVPRNFSIIEDLTECTILRHTRGKVTRYLLDEITCCGTHEQVEFKTSDYIHINGKEWAILSKDTALLIPLQSKKLDLAILLGYPLSSSSPDLFYKDTSRSGFIVINDDLKYRVFDA